MTDLHLLMSVIQVPKRYAYTTFHIYSVKKALTDTDDAKIISAQVNLVKSKNSLHLEWSLACLFEQKQKTETPALQI